MLKSIEVILMDYNLKKYKRNDDDDDDDLVGQRIIGSLGTSQDL